VRAEVATDAAALCAEILAEGRRAAEAIGEEARRQGEEILARARLEAEAASREAAEGAQREGARRAERLLAGVAVEVLRMRASRVGALLDSVRERARKELLREVVSPAALAAMAAGALARMEGESLVLRVGVGEVGRLGEGLAAEVVRRAGREGVRLAVSEDPSITTAGFGLGDVDGHQTWDGRLTARLDRLWPALRIEVAAGLGLSGEGGGAP